MRGLIGNTPHTMNTTVFTQFTHACGVDGKTRAELVIGINTHDDGVIEINPRCVPTVIVCLGVGTDNDCHNNTNLIPLG